MKLQELDKITKLYFGYEEIARVFKIRKESAKVTASRYVRQGLLIRVKRNMYVRKDVWKSASQEEKFVIANLGQTPSYISLMTALDFYGLTTQMQRNFFESVALKRTREITVDGISFRYSRINNTLYFGFQKEKDYFIACPEKALLDSLYLMSYGRYGLDMEALDLLKFDRLRLLQLSRKYPSRTRNLLKKNGLV